MEGESGSGGYVEKQRLRCSLSSSTRMSADGRCMTNDKVHRKVIIVPLANIWAEAS